MQTVTSNWTWIDFILFTGLHIFFLIGLFIFIPIMLYFHFKLGLKYGFIQKVNDPIFGKCSVLLKLIISIVVFISINYYFFIEGDFFKYWNNVLLFFEITPK